jgi:HPt (histidine-containing phosphotransfer) domain-containing protein
MTQLYDSFTPATLNLPELLIRLDNDRELLSELIILFQKKYPVLLRQLREYINVKDVIKIESTSHALKGMLSCLSANQSVVLANRIEEMGRDGKTCGLPDALTVFEGEVAKLLAELDRFATKVGT